MYFQNIEFIETDKFQYLMIHKNGSSSIGEAMKDINFISTTEINLNKIKWTVIRDPYERFVSGLRYDLLRHDVNIKDINYSSSHNTLVNYYTRAQKNLNHATSQVPYLINTNIDWYVDIKDLDMFLKMHFNVEIHSNENNVDIDLNLNKKDIMKYLDLDYYVYNKIIQSDHLWKWFNGKIF